MIRLILYIIIFSLGAVAGTKYQEVTSRDACLNAGGSVDPRGFCKGIN